MAPRQRTGPRTSEADDVQLKPADRDALPADVETLSQLVGKTVFQSASPSSFTYHNPRPWIAEPQVPAHYDDQRREVWVRSAGANLTFTLGRGGERDEVFFQAHSHSAELEGAKMTLGFGDQKIEGTFKGVCPDGLGFGITLPKDYEGPVKIEGIESKSR